ncbi:unnamed protein product, partial [Mesorhabditis spiculigera]
MASRYGILLLCGIVGIVYGQCPANSQYIGELNSCLLVYNHPATFDQAEKICSIYGGHLASIHSAFENHIYAAYMSRAGMDRNKALIGLWNNGSMWQWNDQTDGNYWRWADMAGEGSCATLETDGVVWYCADCQSAFPFLCKFAVQKQRCAPSWTFYEKTGMCYHVGQNSTYANAQTYCQTFGGNLASVHSADENEFIYQLAYSAECVKKIDVWLAGTTILGGKYKRAADQVTWEDGTITDYQHEMCLKAADGGPLLLEAYPSTCGGTCSDGEWAISGHPLSTVYPNFICKTSLTNSFRRQ